MGVVGIGCKWWGSEVARMQGLGEAGGCSHARRSCAARRAHHTSPPACLHPNRRRALALLRERGHVAGGQPVVQVQSGRNTIWRATSTHHIQTRLVPE